VSDQTAPPKQRHTAHRIWCRLKAERPEAAVAESTVRQYVRKRKIELGLVHSKVFIPQTYQWGLEGQVDWYEARAAIDCEDQKVYVFCLRSMGSGGAFHRAYPHVITQRGALARGKARNKHLALLRLYFRFIELKANNVLYVRRSGARFPVLKFWPITTGVVFCFHISGMCRVLTKS
jgi:hypothetical protein